MVKKKTLRYLVVIGEWGALDIETREGEVVGGVEVEAEAEAEVGEVVVDADIEVGKVGVSVLDNGDSKVDFEGEADGGGQATGAVLDSCSRII